MTLNERQRRFADEYVVSGVAYSAAIKAGYSEKYAKTNSHVLLENTRIENYIAERMEKLKSSKVADQTEIMEFLTSVIRGEVTEPVLLMDGVGTQVVIELKPGVSVRKAAAVDLGKRYAMWTDKKIVDGDIGISVVVDYGDDEDS